MVELKPMDVGEILDGALTIYRRHFGLLLRIGIIALWIPACVTIYVQVSGGPQQHLALYFGNAFLQYFAGLFLTAGAIRIISDSYLGRETTLAQALGLGAEKMMPLFGVGLGKALLLSLIGGGSMAIAAIAIPALATAGAGPLGVVAMLVAMVGAFWGTIYVACGYAVTTQVVVLESLDGSFDSFGRSWELTRGLRGKVFLVALVTYIIYFVPVAGVGGVVGVMAATGQSGATLLAVILALLPVVLTPILACVFTLLYYDLRIRREGFDLQVLSQQLVSS